MNYQHFDREQVYANVGIILLTGEACGIGIRCLVDLTEQADDLMHQFLGIPRETPFSAPMNRGHSSMYIAWELLWGKALPAFLILATTDVQRVMYTNSKETGEHFYAGTYDALDEVASKYRQFRGGDTLEVRRYDRSMDPGNGLSNRGAMWGQMH